jgi:hypothetical protein
MLRVAPFSETVPLGEMNAARARASQLEVSVSLAPRAFTSLSRFGYLFPDLQKDPTAILPTSASTVQALRDLGLTMSEPGIDPLSDSDIPSAYTYLGQFIDHDISLMEMKNVNLTDPNLMPLSPAEIGDISNLRSPGLDLDNIYSATPQVGGDRLLVGKVFSEGPRPPSKGDGFFDLPRADRSKDPLRDREPRIGDRRDEETTIIGQLHVAFLRAHNAIVERGNDYCAARSLLRRYYQAVIVHDFLPRVADPKIVAELLAWPWKTFDPAEGEFFMPLEFSVAAFRFGHSMVRNSYVVNNFKSASLLRLFSILGRYTRMPDNWIIQWEKSLDGGVNRARLIDTRLSAGLLTLPGLPPGDERRLPVRTLLRGYLLRLPTGQAVAAALGLSGAEVMSALDIEAVAARIPGSAQLAELRKERVADDGTKWTLSQRTPLWFYILAEAAHSCEVLKRGHQLGPVGSRLVAGVLIALVRRSKDSILKMPGWSPDRDPGFKLSDLLRLAGAL